MPILQSVKFFSIEISWLPRSLIVRRRCEIRETFGGRGYKREGAEEEKSEE